MNILVLLQAIRDPRALTVNRRAQKVFVNRDDFICNPSDKNALEAALRFADAPLAVGEGPEVRVTAVAFGTGPSETVLREARAVGAQRAILVRDDLLHNVEPALITLGLRRVIERAGDVDLVLLGADVLDRDDAQVGPRLAAALGWPFLGELHHVEAAGGKASGVTARGAAFHRVEADLPAVAACVPDSNKPRYPNAARVITTFSTPDAIEVWSASDLGLSESDLSPVTEARGESFPPERELGRRLEGDVVGQLVEVIRRA
jgi:electron transfer flavoprotein beta subunit